MRQAAQAGLVAVPDPGDVDEREVVGLTGCQEAPFQGCVDQFRVLEAAARGHEIDRVVVLDQFYCLIDGAELVHGRILQESHA